MPSRAKYFRSLEDGNTDVGALVDGIQPPAMVFEEGIDFTEPEPVVAAPAPAAAAPQSFELPPPAEYDATGDEKAIAHATARDRRNELLRGLEMGSKQAIAGITGTPTADAFLTSTNEAGAARAASDKARGRFDDTQKQRRTEMLRAMELGVRAAPKPTDPLATKRVEVLESETERRKTKDALEAQVIEERLRKMRAPKPVAPTPAPDRVPVADMTLSFQGDPSTPKEVRLVGAKAVREKAAQWGTALAGLGALKSALTEFVRSPTPANRAKLYGPALSAAGATNAGIGQGAMSGDEKAAQYQALGVNVGDLPGIQAMVERAFGDPAGAARDMVARVTAMEDLAKKTVIAAGQPYGYLPDAPRNQTADGKVSVRSKATGNIVRVSKSLAEKMLKEGTGEAAQ